MGRHATHSSTARRGWRPPAAVLVSALAVVVVVAAALVWWLAGSDAGSGTCAHPRAVRVTVAPELAAVTKDLLSGNALAGACVAADVTGEDPLQTAAALTAGAGSDLPDVWVPDSSAWPAQTHGPTLDAAGSMATSPVVLATSRASADDLGWSQSAPGWLDVVVQALSAGRSVPSADLTANARQIGVSLAVEETGNGTQISDEELRTSLSLSEAGAPLADVRDAAIQGDPHAGLFAATEQDVAATHLAGDSDLVALYPQGGSTYLDYPVVRVGDPGNDRRDAVDAVVAALTSADAATAVRAAGFRDADGNAPDGAGPDTGTQEAAPQRLPLEPDAATAAIQQANRVLAPSRLLTVIDTSTSMESVAGNGTRITLAADAARTALALLPDEFSVGLWTFAYKVNGEDDWAERVPLRALDSDVDGASQRQALGTALDALPQSLTSGGTGLYDTALAAVRSAREQYQQGAVSSVVLLTDGKNDDDAGGISLQGLVDTLRSEADPDRPVQLIGVGLGPEADMDALTQMAQATGGHAYSAQNPEDLQNVLFDAIRSR